MRIVVYGMPAPQGSKRFVGTSKAGRGILVESSAKVKPWRQDVRAAAVEWGESPESAGIGLPMACPLCVRIVFTLPKPKSAPKRRRTWPDKKPDLSKLVRSTEDALTEAGIWRDDAQVITIMATKRYPGEGVDALRIPGAVIEISEVKE